ncbi:MAG TPA: TIGR01777 family oxidoreductase [Pyrinomonadaceae bacterium]|nr:TIGR01777 family oxidoreductase [Pyrinomonadaceae bacterium]
MSEVRASKGRVVLAGGSGFLGRALAEEFVREGYEVVVLTRRPSKSSRTRVREVAWDGRNVCASWARELEGAAAVVNLTGRSVDCRHTAANRREILESRVLSVEAVGRAIRACAEPPRVLVQAGSLAVYGDAGTRVCDEHAPAGKGFPVDVCLRWEGAFDSLELPRTRKVFLRIGFVLGGDGGALPTLARLARFYLGGPAGDGRQYISWLHVRDFCRLVLWCVGRPDASGVFNATGPCPVTNAEFMCELRCALKRPWGPRTPAWLVRLGAFILRTEAELALTGRRCIPDRLVEMNFKFIYTNLESALADLLQPRADEFVSKPRAAAREATGRELIPVGATKERERLSAATGTR